MEPSIEPTTWAAVSVTLAGAASIIVTAGIPVLLLLFKNFRTSQEIVAANLAKQLDDAKHAMAKIERQTNGAATELRARADKQARAIAELKAVLDAVNATPEGRAVLDDIMQARRSTPPRTSPVDVLLRGLLDGDV
jgi:hypothetical protein